MQKFLDSFFKVSENSSKLSVEIFAGITTFMTMAYIVFVQPMIMSGKMFGFETGMEFGALFTGTCLAAAFSSILMGVLANYPIALAPGMGENFFFVLTVLPFCATLPGVSGSQAWHIALGVVLISGILFAILSFLNLRKILLGAVSPSLTKAIAAGIGLFIALIGLENGGIISSHAGHYVLAVTSAKKDGFSTVLIFLVGLAVTASLHARKIRGSILAGIASGGLVAYFLGKINFEGFPIGFPSSVMPVFAKADIQGVLANFANLLPFIAVFLFMDVFDTLGTMIGVCTEANIMKGNELPNSNKAFCADAVGTVFGAICGHSTVTSYIESAAGVEYGARTGLAAVTTGLCFVLALFLAPFVSAIAKCSAVTAPALVVVGALMLKNVKDIEWSDNCEAIPSFLVLAGIPFTYSIGDGLMLGFISYPLLKLFSGNARKCGWLNYIIALLLMAYLFFIRNKI